MTKCNDLNLNAFHDGELPESDRGRVEVHLRECEACNRELAWIRETSRLLQSAPIDDITPEELARVHDAVDGIDDYRVFRIGGTLGLIAASILIIGMAWLNAIPTSGTNPGAPGPVASGPTPEAWERTAVTLRVYAPAADGIQKHDSDFADYMLDGLAMGR